MLSIPNILNKLDIVYYSYDKKNNKLVLDSRYSNTHTLGELIKLTYYFTNKHVKFDVLKDKSIVFEKKITLAYRFKLFLKNMIKNMRNKNKNIYILNEKKIKYAKNLPLFEIKYFKNVNIKIENYDALIFTSQNGIKALDSITTKWRNIPSYVISEQSGKLVKELHGKLKFFSRARHGNVFAEELTPLLRDKKVLYVRGEKVASDIMKILKNKKIECDEAIVYQSVLLPNIQAKRLPKNAKIIFSSPSTVEYFLKYYEWKDTYKAIAIGNTTAAALPSYMEYFISETTSLDSCVEKALEIS